jgi:hypothetical protein
MALLLLAAAGPAGAPPIGEAPPPPRLETHPFGSEPSGLGSHPDGNELLKRDFLAPSGAPPAGVPLRAGRLEDSRGTLGEGRESPSPNLEQRFGQPVTLPDDSKAYHVQPNLLVRAGEITDTVVGYLNTPINSRKMVFAGYFDRSLDDYQRVAEASDGSFVDLGAAEGDPTSLFRQNAGQVVAIVGHSVDGYFIRDRKKDDGSYEEVGRIAISDLETAAAKSGVLLFLLTCQGAAASQSPSVVGDLWTPSVVAGIVRARAATTYGQFFAAFGTAENPTLAQNIETDAEGVLSATFATTVDEKEVRGVAAGPATASPPPPPASPPSPPTAAPTAPPPHSIFDSGWFWLIVGAAVIVGLLAWRRR